MNLPYSNVLPIDRLSQCFNDTTNSYKFYWFLAILEELSANKLKGEKHSNRMSMLRLSTRMVAMVWHPLDFYKLSFGKQDGFKKIAEFISARIVVDSQKDLFQQIEANLTKQEQEEVNKQVLKLLKWVPYRFIRPFFSEVLKGKKDYKVNKLILQLTNEAFVNNHHQTPYRFLDKDTIEVDILWEQYFKENQAIIRGFIHWHLVRFLQKHNPNVIGLSEKLFKPTTRDLKIGRKFWTNYLKSNKTLTCIYSNALVKNNFSLDHFLPWSYVVHDELWNLTPTFKNINSSKGNYLPDLNSYILPFAKLQYKAFHNFLENGTDVEKNLESYTKLFNAKIEDVKQISEFQFVEKIKETISPMHQIAKNMGFPSNWTYQP